MTAQLLRQAGINLEVQAMDWVHPDLAPAESKAPEDGGWNIFHTSWTILDLNNPLVYQGVQSGGLEGAAWFRWPNDPEIEALRESFARAANPAHRSSSPLRSRSVRWTR